MSVCALRVFAPRRDLTLPGAPAGSTGAAANIARQTGKICKIGENLQHRAIAVCACHGRQLVTHSTAQPRGHRTHSRWRGVLWAGTPSECTINPWEIITPKRNAPSRLAAMRNSPRPRVSGVFLPNSRRICARVCVCMCAQ